MSNFNVCYGISCTSLASYCQTVSKTELFLGNSFLNVFCSILSNFEINIVFYNKTEKKIAERRKTSFICVSKK